MLRTWEERFRQLETATREARKRADDAAEYAERTNRLHHQAICRMNELITGSYTWPSPHGTGEAHQL